jgi:hypothetical protein
MSFKKQEHLSLSSWRKDTGKNERASVTIPFEQKIFFFVFNQSYLYLQEQTAPIVVANLNDSQGRKKNLT